jgi:hypothetical protein
MRKITAPLSHRFLIFVSLLFFAAGAQAFFAQDNVRLALFPIWGSPREIAAQFSYVVDKYTRQAERFTPFTVSLTNLPADVPAGGYPPFVCPTSLITDDAPYSLTGEIVYDPQTQKYNLRLYLWEVRTARLLYSDMLSAKNSAECEAAMPALLDWLFSWLGNITAVGSGIVIVRRDPETTAVVPATPPPPARTESSNAAARDGSLEQAKDEKKFTLLKRLFDSPDQKLLYIGVRGGASFKFYTRQQPSPFAESEIVHYNNFITAVQAAYYFMPSLAVQAEIAMTSDYAPFIGTQTAQGTATPYKLTPITSYSLMVPVAIKGTIYYDIFSASALAGAYFVIPLGTMRNELLGGDFNYRMPIPLGITAGISLGAKAGIGNIIFDIRWCSDLSQTVTDGGAPVYQRNMLMFSAGYEIGLFERKR